jgi:TolB-like protein
VFKPSIIETPTGKFIWVGTIPRELDGKIFNTKEEAEKASTAMPA